MNKFDLTQFVIETPMFQVRATLDSVVMLVNEFTFRNLQLQTALKAIEPFWFLNQKNEWEKCRTTGVCSGEPYSEGWISSGDILDTCALGLSDRLAMKLFWTLKKDN